MASAAFNKFDEVFDRGISMIEGSVALYDMFKNEGIDDFPESYNDAATFSDMGRSGLVIAVGAMDAYFTDRFCENLISHLKKDQPSRKLVALLEKAGIDVISCLKMFSMDRPFRRIRNLLDDYVETLVTQRFEAIDELYKCYSIPSLAKGVEIRTGRTTLLKSIKVAIQRRHQIVHRGDLNSHKKLVKFDANEMLKRLRLMRIFVMAADELLDERFRKS
jgi:hypothetical protein